MIHEKGFADKEKALYREIVRQNIVTAILGVLHEMEIHGIQFPTEELKQTAHSIKDRLKSSDSHKAVVDMRHSLAVLTSQKTLKDFMDTYLDVEICQLNHYLFRSLEKILSDSYAPTDYDILRDVIYPLIEQDVMYPLIEQDVIYPLIEQDVIYPLIEQDVMYPLIEQDVMYPLIEQDVIYPLIEQDVIYPLIEQDVMYPLIEQDVMYPLIEQDVIYPLIEQDVIYPLIEQDVIYPLIEQDVIYPLIEQDVIYPLIEQDVMYPLIEQDVIYPLIEQDVMYPLIEQDVMYPLIEQDVIYPLIEQDVIYPLIEQDVIYPLIEQDVIYPLIEQDVIYPLIEQDVIYPLIEQDVIYPLIEQDVIYPLIEQDVIYPLIKQDVIYPLIEQDVIYPLIEQDVIYPLNEQDVIYPYRIVYATIMLCDVDGHCTVKKKWLQNFENVSAILFTVALSSYDARSKDQDEQTELHDALSVFTTVSEYDGFRKSPIILFLNKKDIFQQKLKKVPLTVAFPDYKGTNEFNEACLFVQSKFESCMGDTTDRLTVHITNATDTPSIRSVFDSSLAVVLDQA
nr:guanine nucleotide-binding protein G(o) subunit alpha-like [Biomphalaria glabrata]